MVKKLPANAGDAGSVPGSGRFPWRKKLQPNPVFIPGKSHGQRRLAGYSPRSCKSQHDLATKYNNIDTRYDHQLHLSDSQMHNLSRPAAWLIVQTQGLDKTSAFTTDFIALPPLVS